MMENLVYNALLLCFEIILNVDCRALMVADEAVPQMSVLSDVEKAIHKTQTVSSLDRLLLQGPKRKLPPGRVLV